MSENLPDYSKDLVIAFRRGKLRARGYLFTLVVGLAMATLLGNWGGWDDSVDWAAWGAMIAAANAALQVCLMPPRAGIWRLSPHELSRARWFDRQSVVIGGSFFGGNSLGRSFGLTIYRDEVAPEQFARLRRRCFGLPE